MLVPQIIDSLSPERTVKPGEEQYSRIEETRGKATGRVLDGGDVTRASLLVYQPGCKIAYATVSSIQSSCQSQLVDEEKTMVKAPFVLRE